MKRMTSCLPVFVMFVFVGLWVAAVPGSAYAQMSVVTVDAAIQDAHEVGPSPGIFVVSRTGDTESALTVNFVLSGTAVSGSDYIMWERSATFEPGATTALVTVLPRNDAEREPAETIVLALQPSSDYAVGLPDRATVAIADFAYGASYPGVWDWADASVGLQKDLIYLDARVIGGYLLIRVGLNGGMMSTVHLWLDTDQDPTTGDIRQGYAAGPEYRVEAFLFFSPDYQLWRLPRTQPDCQDPACPERSVLLRGPAWMESANVMAVAIPLTAIGNPSAVDVFATTNTGAIANRVVGDGDRAPDFGALDTRTGQVVVRRPSVTSSRVFTDPVGDLRDSRGFDLVAAQFDTIADQTFITLTWSRQFDSTSFLPGPSGQVLIDSDRDLLTGGFPLLDPQEGIPSWGADMRLKFDISVFGTGVTNLLLQFDGTGSGAVMFGQASNDGRWMASGDSVWLACSTSVLDAFLKTSDSARRIRGNGQVIAAVDSLFNSEQGVADSIPGQKRVFDTATGRVLTPLAWGQPTVVADARELFGLAGVDLTGVQAEVVGENLVIRGILASWLTSDTDNHYEILLDTDSNELTGPVGRWSGVGADYRVDVASVDGFTAVYLANLVLPNGTSVVADSLLFAEPSFYGLESGRFTVTIPLAAIGNPERVRFVITSGMLGGVGRMDTAPSAPVVIDTRR